MNVSEKRWDLQKKSNDARARLEEDLLNFSDHALDRSKTAIKGIETELRSSLENITSTVQDGVTTLSDSANTAIRNLKNELNLARYIRENPWGWLSGAAISGGALGLYLSLRSGKLRSASYLQTKTPSVLDSPRDLAQRKFHVPDKYSWSMLLLELALFVWRIRRPKTETTQKVMPKIDK